MLKRIVSLMLSATMISALLTSCSQPQFDFEFIEEDSVKEYTSTVEGAALTIYVDANANEGGDGSEKTPFKTITEAQAKIRELKELEGLPVGGIRVLVKDGNYDLLSFTLEDTGTAESPITYVSENKWGAAIAGGVILSPADFKPLNEEEKSRIIDAEARNKIMKVDLTSYGLTAEDWGEIHPGEGTGTMSDYYDDNPEYYPCEVSYNGDRMILAKYPNEGNVYTTGVVTHGDAYEHGSLRCKYDGYDDHQQHWDIWNTDIPRNPEPGIVVMDDETVERVSLWKSHDDIWTFGLGKFSWSRVSNQVKFIDLQTKNLGLKRTVFYGFAVDNPYYFYNVFEELDTEGEYYIDRVNGVLYLFADSDFNNAEISISCATSSIIHGTDISHITLKGFMALGSRVQGVELYGDNLTVDSCKVFNIRGSGIYIRGNNTTVYNCEVYNVGEYAISVVGGNSDTLEKSNNLICNNYIYNFAFAKSVEGLITYPGCGSTICHNEICNSPHVGAMLSTLDIFEYNELYNLCTDSGDSGAIYLLGYRPQMVQWSTGVVTRYNFVHDIGSKEKYIDQLEEAHGFFFDGPSCGWTAYGNIFMDILGCGIKSGGGRDYVVENNIFMNCSESPYYNNASLRTSYESPNAEYSPEEMQYVQAYQSIKQNSIYMEAFPYLVDVIADFNQKNEIRPEDINNPNLMINAVGIVKNNIAYYHDQAKKDYKLHKSTKDICIPLGMIENNPIINVNAISDFVAYYNGDFSLKEDASVYELIPDFEPIPFDKIGRIK